MERVVEYVMEGVMECVVLDEQALIYNGGSRCERGEIERLWSVMSSVNVAVRSCRFYVGQVEEANAQ